MAERVPKGLLVEDEHLTHEVLTRLESNYKESPDMSALKEYLAANPRSLVVDDQIPEHLVAGEHFPLVLNHSSPPEHDSVKNHEFVALSFAGCGLLGVYHIGVAWALREHGGQFLDKVKWFAGASAGSLIAATLATRGTSLEVLKECKKFYVGLVDEVRDTPGGIFSVSLLDRVDKFFSKFLPNDAAEKANNRLFVSVTKLSPFHDENMLVSHYSSNTNLIRLLLASSCIPMTTCRRFNVVIEGTNFVDGGITENLPTLPMVRTVTVSPFHQTVGGPIDICPLEENAHSLVGKLFQSAKDRLKLNLEKRSLYAIYPASKAQVDEFFEEGKRDAIRFLKKENLYTES